MTPRRFVPALGFGVIVALVLALYARTTAYGLFADDYQWLVGAHGFDLGRLLNLSERNHFYRPVVEIHFPVALALCGRSAACFHWLNIALHAAI